MPELLAYRRVSLCPIPPLMYALPLKVAMPELLVKHGGGYGAWGMGHTWGGVKVAMPELLVKHVCN